MPHAMEKQSQVRALAHLLAHGQISWADYREQRAEKVRRIVAGDDPITYDKAIVFDDPTSPKDMTIDHVVIDMNEVEREPARWPAFVAIAALGLVILASGWVVYQSQKPPVVATAPTVDMAVGEKLLADFRDTGDWSAAAIERLVGDWNSLTREDRAAAMGSLSWRRIQNDIRQRINEQQALKPIDESGEAAAQEARLSALRETLIVDQDSSS